MRAVSAHSSHHPPEVPLAQFTLDVNKGGIKPHSFYLIAQLSEVLFVYIILIQFMTYFFFIPLNSTVVSDIIRINYMD